MNGNSKNGAPRADQWRKLDCKREQLSVCSLELNEYAFRACPSRCKPEDARCPTGDSFQCLRASRTPTRRKLVQRGNGALTIKASLH